MKVDAKAPVWRLKNGGLRPVIDRGALLGDRPTLSPANLNGLKRIGPYGPGLRREGH